MAQIPIFSNSHSQEFHKDSDSHLILTLNYVTHSTQIKFRILASNMNHYISKGNFNV